MNVSSKRVESMSAPLLIEGKEGEQQCICALPHSTQ